MPGAGGRHHFRAFWNGRDRRATFLGPARDLWRHPLIGLGSSAWRPSTGERLVSIGSYRRNGLGSPGPCRRSLCPDGPCPRLLDGGTGWACWTFHPPGLPPAIRTLTERVPRDRLGPPCRIYLGLDLCNTFAGRDRRRFLLEPPWPGLPSSHGFGESRACRNFDRHDAPLPLKSELSVCFKLRGSELGGIGLRESSEFGGRSRRTPLVGWPSTLSSRCPPLAVRSRALTAASDRGSCFGAASSAFFLWWPGYFSGSDNGVARIQRLVCIPGMDPDPLPERHHIAAKSPASFSPGSAHFHCRSHLDAGRSCKDAPRLRRNRVLTPPRPPPYVGQNDVA